ncbi:hypothetical protein SISNIDRAFT_498281 [Sistotremastrum niveocremeum HHB9708]|uniref:AB hydrolase-1 domain-containing protein n=1 Tax=Sistotremastrum niveocremeum HHB9708 TaxID=1314777 RepID=A0A164NJM6_9AGAM|nr:hypothetical protein SISNIDRAFT_498281 [Sistotremastrum niveocremeum HHB9708]
MMNWLCETYIVDQRPSYHYRVIGNRYQPDVPIHRTRRQPGPETVNHISLVFLHAAGMFKECFEPVIELLFDEYSFNPGKALVIDEAWSIECPNHGYSSVLNRDDIRTDNRDFWPIQEYSKAAYTYLTGKPGGHDLSKRRLVLIGHSFGAVIMYVYTSSGKPTPRQIKDKFKMSRPFLTQMQPKIHFESIILGDPVISPRGREKDLVGKFFMDVSLSRKDIWENREEARKYLDGSKAFKHWPSAMKTLFVCGNGASRLTSMPWFETNKRPANPIGTYGQHNAVLRE